MDNETYTKKEKQMKTFSRTQLLIGEDALIKLNNARVAVFGVGGVGGYVVEGLVRSGIGSLDLIDSDTVSESNLNRQIIALCSTVGKYKTEAAKERILDINPNATVMTHNVFYTEETAQQFDFSAYDYVVDAIDTVAGKLSLIENAVKAGVPIISAMGAGNKLNATVFEVSDISKTSVCPLARVMRRELKKRGIEHVKVVYSKEEPVKTSLPEGEKLPQGKKQIPGSISFVPSVMGLIISGEVIKDLIKE